METMKKTFTVTFHYFKNYGAFLQSYALQKILGKENYILDFKQSFGHFIDKTKPLWFLRAIKWYFASFKYTIPHLKEYHKLKVSKKHCDGYAYIVGSDQVWNYKFIKGQEHRYFLQFIPKNAKRISYAASLGTSEWPSEFEHKVLPWLRKFHAISVREENSAEYLRSFGLNAVCVCDPTVLHKADFYRKEFSACREISNAYSFIYRIRENIPMILKCKTITVNLQEQKTIVSASDWLSLIDNAEFVLTDSFHCIVFCLLFHKPFAVFQNNGELKGMNSRFSTILGKTNLEYRLLQGAETEEQILEIINREIDWRRIDEILEEWRSYSKNWLMEAIK